MKESVLRQCGVTGKRIIQIKPNVNYKLFKNNCDIQMRNTIEFFYPTSNAVYKNNELIIEAAEQLDRKNLKYHCELTIEGECSKSKNVSFVGRMSYEDVIKKYYRTCLVFPSYIETFGYPLVEARAVGAIILAGDCEFSRELLEGYDNAYFFNPFVVNELADLMEKVIKGEIVQKEIVEKVETKENSWKYVVDEIVGVI